MDLQIGLGKKWFQSLLLSVYHRPGILSMGASMLLKQLTEAEIFVTQNLCGKFNGWLTKNISLSSACLVSGFCVVLEFAFDLEMVVLDP